MKLTYNDERHAYWLEEDGKRKRRLTGITSVAKVPDDTYHLQLWSQRQVLIGVAREPKLLERAAAHFDDKSALNGIVKDAMRAARSHEAADEGTAVHRILERHDLGEDMIDTPLSRAKRAAYDKALKSAGLEPVPEFIERIVLYPKLGIAGRFDRLFLRRRDRKLVVGDIKNGANAIRYPHAIAVQLGLYANATLLCGPLDRGNEGETEEFSQMPEIDGRWGYIVHTANDQVSVHKVNIDVGHDIAMKQCVPILEWRRRNDLVVPVGGGVDVVDRDAEAPADRVQWVQARIALIGELGGDETRAAVAREWPANVQPRGPWSDSDIDLLDAALAKVERATQASFAPSDPAGASVGLA